MRISMASALLAIGTLTLPAAARAQGDQALGFRAGQWGADFQVAGGFTGAGAIKFTSPTRAWLVDLGSQVVHASGTQPGIVGSISGTSVNLSVKVGRRMYGTITHRVAPWTAVGVTASYGWLRSTTDTVTSFGAGVFGSLGATWLITPHLGVGAQWSLIFNYSHQSTSGSVGTTKDNAINITLPNMALAGQLYF